MVQRPVVLVSELFPPAVGGSAVLLGEVYSRLPSTPVLVVTDRSRSSGTPPAGIARMHIQRWGLATPHWGILDPRGWPHHVRTTLALARLGRGRSGVLHCGRVLPEGLWAYAAKRLMGVPFICWSHGEDATSARASREYRVLIPRIYNAADRVIANSRNTAEILASLGVDGRRVRTVHPGVDAARFGSDARGARVRRAHGLEGRFVLLTVARVESRKGQDLVLRALSSLRETHPDLRYVIVGTGSDLDRLRHLAAELGVTDRVVWVGGVPFEDLPEYYAACDLFVHPNREEGTDIEGFGLVFLEAAAAGRPAIGGRSGGVPETMIDGETGVLVGGRDAAELAAAIAAFADDPARGARMGRAARDRACREFTWPGAAAAVEAVHAEVCGRP